MYETPHDNLTDRDRKILQSAIEEYIDNIQPVGSQFLKKAYDFDCSSATIRNTFVKLEALGLLMHPFTSAGRVPTDAGYRFYVDEILPNDDPMIDTMEKNTMEELKRFTTQIDRLLQATVTVLSNASSLFSVALLYDVRKSILTNLELVELSSERVMMIIELNSGLIRSMVLDLQVSLNRSQLQNISEMLLEMLRGLSLEDIRKTFGERVREKDIVNHEIVQILLKNPISYFNVDYASQVFTSSFSPLLQYPEIQDVKTISELMPGLQTDYIKTYFQKNPNNVIIGSENTDSRFQELSIIRKDFKLDTVHGQLAIIGPTRMPYRKVRNTLNKFAELLPNVI